MGLVSKRWVVMPLLVMISFVPWASGTTCHNHCSGHGECNNYGQCKCWDGFEGWDCSLRSCPSATAWSDAASYTDRAHNDAICSNMGLCDRTKGECLCHQGFEGLACERMSCPNDCNGHGQCLSMAEAAAMDDGYRLTRITSYDAWDAYMIHGCVCDDGYEGYDCSLKPCPRSDSALTSGQQDESIVLCCRCGDDCSGSVRLRYKGQYVTIYPTMSAKNVAAKLMELPTIKSDAAEYTSSPVTVSFSGNESEVCSAGGTTSTITFTRDPGDLPPVYIKFNKLKAANGTDVYLNTEVALTCTCDAACGGFFRFVGKGGQVTGKLPFDADESLIQASLSELSDLATANITIDMGGEAAACVESSTVNTSISIAMTYGNYPLTVIGSLFYGGQPGGELKILTNDGNKEQEYCAGLGTCDFSSGECTCDENYGYDQEYGPCGQCPGFVLRPTIDILPSQSNDWQLYFTDGGLNVTFNYTTDPELESTVPIPGYYWFSQGTEVTDERVLFANATNATTDISNALALDMTYRTLYFGQHNKVMRMPLPSDLSAEDLKAATSSMREGLVEEFVTLPEGQNIGYLELDLRPDYRFLYWTVPGEDSQPDGKVQRKKLSNDSNPEHFEDLSGSIQRGMANLGYNLTDPLGIALDLRDQKVYFVDAQVRGVSGGQDGVVIRCELDGTGVEVAASHNLSDPRAIVLDVKEGVMYLTDTHIPTIIRTNMRNYTYQEVYTILSGVYQERLGELGVETYYQPLLSPQSLQFETRDDELHMLYFADYETGYIYKVRTNGSDAEPFIRMGKPKSFIFDLGEGYPTFTLYYDCYGHGVCSGAPYFTCSCDDGWEGNCAQRSCPQGPAWFDEAEADGSAHALTECSNRGICNRNNGTCTCQHGFTGDACQRMACPNDCSGNGKCLSMRQLGLAATNQDLVPAPASYGSSTATTSSWDADSVFGCYCDWMGYQGGSSSYVNLSDWTGYDCSRRTCPTGDDSRGRCGGHIGWWIEGAHMCRTPLPTSHVLVGDIEGSLRIEPAAMYNSTDFEHQNVSCVLTRGAGSSGNSSFSISFRQGTTNVMSGNVTVSGLERALESLPTIGDVEVTVAGHSPPSPPPLCSVSGLPTASVVFKTELGDLPLLSVASADGVSIDVTEVVAGTKVDMECSRHGHCNPLTGECVCFEGWDTSDGDGNVGHRLDCGWYHGQAGVFHQGG